MWLLFVTVFQVLFQHSLPLYVHPRLSLKTHTEGKMRVLSARQIVRYSGVKKRRSCLRGGLQSVTNGEFAHSGVEAIIEKLALGDDSNGSQGVFYNKVASINRDLSVLILSLLVRERVEKMLGQVGDLGHQQHDNEGCGWREIATDTVDTNGLVVLDAMCASGVRALRYLSEIPGIKRVIANDYDSTACEMARRAAELCPGAGNRLDVQHGDALDVMYMARAHNRSHENGFDVIDIDPYGSAARYLDAGVQAIKNGGLLMVTSTDMQVLSGTQVRHAPYVVLQVLLGGEAKGSLHYCSWVFQNRGGIVFCVSISGNTVGVLISIKIELTSSLPVVLMFLCFAVLFYTQPDTAYTRYGSVPTRGGYHHEMSLRILLHAISTSAARYRRSMAPVLSVALDHYVRVYVRILDSPAEALLAGRKAAYVFQSEWCPSFFLQPVVPSPPSQPAPLYFETQTQDSAATSSPLPVEKKRCLPPLGGGTCLETGGPVCLGGPIWSGPIHNREWVMLAIEMTTIDTKGPAHGGEGGQGENEDHATRAMDSEGQLVNSPRLVSGPRLTSLLQAVSHELPDVPLFYHLRGVFAALGLSRSPKRDQLASVLRNLGFRVSGMHRDPLALKTDAPDSIVWDILRCWVRDNPQPLPKKNKAGHAILARPPCIDVSFMESLMPVSPEGAQEGRIFFHVLNPEKRWGPLPRGARQRHRN
ncbi:unnamed protein product, partial [Choristocarpus tenellus]